MIYYDVSRCEKYRWERLKAPPHCWKPLTYYWFQCHNCTQKDAPRIIIMYYLNHAILVAYSHERHSIAQAICMIWIAYLHNSKLTFLHTMTHTIIWPFGKSCHTQKMRDHVYAGSMLEQCPMPINADLYW